MSKARLVECGVYDATYGPGFVLFRAVHVAFGNVEHVICVFRSTCLRHAATRFAQYGYPLAVYKVVDDDDAELAQGIESCLRSALARSFRFKINESRCAIGFLGGS